VEREDDGRRKFGRVRGGGVGKEDGWQVIEESLLKMKNTFNEQKEVGFVVEVFHYNNANL
jgi:hypothetical protein